MKKFFSTLALVGVLTVVFTACSDENIRPKDTVTTDKCQFTTTKGCK